LTLLRLWADRFFSVLARDNSLQLMTVKSPPLEEVARPGVPEEERRLKSGVRNRKPEMAHAEDMASACKRVKVGQV